MRTKYQYVHFHKLSSHYWVCHRNSDIESTVGFLEKFDASREWYFAVIGRSWGIHEIKRQIQYLRDIGDFLGQLNKEKGGKE